jgi:tRNA pseudouridine32 synthase / 23S rRNA pseudouridine746 synthase
LPRPRRLAPIPAAAALPGILYQDPRLIIIDKPAGLPVHAGPRGGPALTDLLPALAGGKRRVPQPAHRLDTDTAGCLVLGRTKPALAALGVLFAAQQAEKTYWAVVLGGPALLSGVIDLPLAKQSTAAAGWRMVVDPSGQPAFTRWDVLGRGPGTTWLALRPATGRTHQLRVHCARAGWPILGDARYGGPAGALMLLARSIRLPLDPPVAAEAPVPPHMHAALGACGWLA